MTLTIVLLGLGIALILAEAVVPSFGVLAILAALALLGAIALAFREGEAFGTGVLVATALLVPSAFLFGLKIFPMTPIGKHMTARGLSFESTPATDERDVQLIGAEGVVEAPLRPAGMARIEGRRVDVVSRGELIEVGVRVRVLEVSGNRVVVGRTT